MKSVPILSTDEVREAFSNVDDEIATEENYTNFDYWLVTERNRVAELATAKERERIIKLLEDPSNWYDINIAVYGKSAGTGYPNTKLVIALVEFIKGEKSE